jgi:hypothetical protein
LQSSIVQMALRRPRNSHLSTIAPRSWNAICSLPQPTEAVSSSAHSDWQAQPCSSWRYRMNWATPSAMSPTSTAPMTTVASCAAEESRVAVHPRDQAQPVQRRRRGDGDIAGGKPERQLHPAIEPMMNQIEHGFKVDSNGNEPLPSNVHNSWVDCLNVKSVRSAGVA